MRFSGTLQRRRGYRDLEGGPPGRDPSIALRLGWLLRFPKCGYRAHNFW